eukprot:192308-Hanusia_phi.AAC.4
MLQNIMSGNWFNMKNNASISGLWGSLPVLEWDNFQISQVGYDWSDIIIVYSCWQTEAIAMFLYTKLGHGESPSGVLVRVCLTRVAADDVATAVGQL